MLSFTRVYYAQYFQYLAHGEIGDHGDHAQRHVDQATKHVQEQKLDHITVEVNAQDLQPPQHHAT